MQTDDGMINKYIAFIQLCTIQIHKSATHVHLLTTVNITSALNNGGWVPKKFRSFY